VNSSILTTVKKSVGVAADDDSFDTDLLMYINTVLATLSQLGVGPKRGFQITDETITWESFIGDDDPRYNMVQTYTYLRVRLLFDPPSNSFGIEAIEKQIEEFGWRINVVREGESWSNPVTTRRSL
jgi:hypothetical protein